MVKHWVYILKTKRFYEDEDEHEDEENILYIGETKRLYRRFNEHIKGRGCKNTKIFRNCYNIQLVGLYNIINNYEFEQYNSIVENYEEYNSIWGLKLRFKNWRENNKLDEYEYFYDFLMIENLITEMCIYLNKNNNLNVKGGKYTKDYSYKDKISSYPSHRPICNCGYPAEVFLSQKDEIWFKCAIANASWIEYNNNSFIIAEPCNYLKKYNTDMKLRQKSTILETRQYSNIVKKFPILNNKGYLNKQELPCSVCKIDKYYPIFNKGYRALCKKCVENRFDELDKILIKKYTIISDSDDE